MTTLSALSRRLDAQYGIEGVLERAVHNNRSPEWDGFRLFLQVANGAPESYAPISPDSIPAIESLVAGYIAEGRVSRCNDYLMKAASVVVGLAAAYLIPNMIQK